MSKPFTIVVRLPPTLSPTTGKSACAQQQLMPGRVLGDLRTMPERPQRHTRQTTTSLHSFPSSYSTYLHVIHANLRAKYRQVRV